MPRAQRLLLCLCSVLVAACGGNVEEEEFVDEDWNVWMERGMGEPGKPQAGSSSCSGIAVPDRGPFHFKVALTFDDGPSIVTTPQIISILREEKVPAAFLVMGVQVNSEALRALLRDVAADPNFIIGSHSWDHPYMSKLSALRVKQQLDNNEHLLDSLGVEYSFFRFPFGSSTCATMNEVKSRGYKPLGWHISSEDWCYAATPDGTCEGLPDPYRNDMIGYVMSQVEQRKGGIILFHDIHQFTANHLRTLIRQLKEQGYTFVSIDDETVFPELNRPGE